MSLGPARAETTAPSPDNPSLLARITGVVLRPRSTFAAVVMRPRSAGVLATLTAVTFAATANTSTTPRIGTLTIAGQTATITQLGQRLTLKGSISNRSGSCPNLTFMLDGRTVHTNNNTEFASDPCNKLKNGTKVDVEGVVQVDTSVLAIRVSSD